MANTHPVTSLTNTLAYFPIAVRTAIADWHNLFENRLRYHIENYEADNAPNNLNPPPPHPTSDEGRTQILCDLQKNYFVSFSGWSPEEIEFFVRLAYPRHLLMNMTQAAEQPMFFSLVYITWQPTYFEWVIFLWKFTGHACELFADVLFLIPDDRKPPLSEMAKILFCDMIEAGYYTEPTCMSVAMAVIPYSREPSCARSHAKRIIMYASALSPRQVGLVIRSLLMGHAQPKDCRCGYVPDQPYCQCVRFGISGRNRVLELDRGREYACILLKLILAELQAPTLHQTALNWTDEMRDVMIASACDYVLSEPAYVSVFKNVVLGWSKPSPPLRQTHPRVPTLIEKDTHRFGNPFADYENARFQTGSCVVSNCKQAAKADCANVSCKTHCEDFIFICHVHRTYPSGDKYQPRLNVNYFTDDHRDRKHQLVPREDI